MRGYNGGNCRIRTQTMASRGDQFRCFLRNGFTGGGYGFINRKRGDGEEETQSKECAVPDTMGLPDGTEYALTDLTAEQVRIVVDGLANYTSVEDVPVEFGEKLVRIK